MKASAFAHPNIAFIKYWGNDDQTLRLPSNGSISMNLGSLLTQTNVEFIDGLTQDLLAVNHKPIVGASLERVQSFMNEIRRISGETRFACIESENNFPMGAGIASSAAAFAALALAGSAAAGLDLSEAECSRLARLGSGSASRSIPAGYCEWTKGNSDADSYSVSLASEYYWHLTDLIAVIDTSHKKVGSSAGHRSAETSPYQSARVASADERIKECREAILERDFSRLAVISEKDCTMMHAVMMTQNPPLFYWDGTSLNLMKAVREWREEGLPCFATLDAGPNVHVICPSEYENQVNERLLRMPGVKSILHSGPGGKAMLL